LLLLLLLLLVACCLLLVACCVLLVVSRGAPRALNFPISQEARGALDRVAYLRLPLTCGASFFFARGALCSLLSFELALLRRRRGARRGVLFCLLFVVCCQHCCLLFVEQLVGVLVLVVAVFQLVVGC
jgi:hypothetical protein